MAQKNTPAAGFAEGVTNALSIIGLNLKEPTVTSQIDGKLKNCGGQVKHYSDFFRGKKTALNSMP